MLLQYYLCIWTTGGDEQEVWEDENDVDSDGFMLKVVLVKSVSAAVLWPIQSVHKYLGEQECENWRSRIPSV